jgi:hypothetical protein
MKTLFILFSEERHQLQIDIDKATSSEEVLKLVHNRLDNLEKVYMNQLNVAQVRLASFFMETLRQSLAVLTAANLVSLPIASQKPILQAGKEIFSPKLILKLLQALICLGILSSLFSLMPTDPGVWTAILLTAVLVGLELLQLDKNNPEDRTTTSQPSEIPQTVLRIDSKVLLDNLADALNIIDLAVARVKETNQTEDDRTLEELPELLNFLQRLMGASLLDRPQMTSELAKLLPQILIEQGIRAQIYQPQNPLSDRDYFDFEPSIDPANKDYVTLTPALLKGDRLLRRGRAIEPAYSEVKE